MRVSLCVGNYATTPYCVPGIGMNVYCMEELCFAIRENAFLIDNAIMKDDLLDWIDGECGLRDLARTLYPLVHKKGSLSAFVVLIQQYIGLYDENVIAEIERVLKNGAGLSVFEKKKSQIDYLVKNKKYGQAIVEYDALIEKWRQYEETSEQDSLPALNCLAKIWNNKGVALAGLMIYKQAAECFLQAFRLVQEDAYYNAYLAAKRMELSEADYIAFASERSERYEHTLSLEKRMEEYLQEWEQQPEYLRMNSRRDLRMSTEKQKYYDESEQLTQALKNGYRHNVSQ